MDGSPKGGDRIIRGETYAKRAWRSKTRPLTLERRLVSRACAVEEVRQEEDAHMILAHVITRYMREAVRMYMQSGQDHRVDWAILAAT